MDTQEKKSIKDLFQDKKFLMSLPVLLIVTSLFLWYVLKDDTSSAVTNQPVSAINSTVPLARTDTSHANNRLDLQQQALDRNPSSETAIAAAGKAMNPTVPGELDGYMYGQKYRPVHDPKALRRIDSTYNPATSPNEVSAGYGRGNPSLPQSLRPGGSRLSVNRPPLSEKDVMLADEPSERRSTVSAGEEERKKAEYKEALRKQERLTGLLEQYNRDKANQKTAEEEKRTVYKVDQSEVISSLNDRSEGGNTFYGLYSEDQKKNERRLLEAEVGTIRAMVYGNQDIMSGSRIKLRLLQSIKVRGVVIPENTLLFGIGSFSTQRVQIKITDVVYEDHIFPVNMTALDIDGIAGVYVPEIQGLPEARQALGQSVGNINMNTYGATTGNVAAMAGASAAQAGIQGVRAIATKKTTLQRAHLKNNHIIYLRQTETPTTTNSNYQQAPQNYPVNRPPNGYPASINTPGGRYDYSSNQ
ncbi:conjugative transposon protein TraM [Spirosoma luteum]|uniref:conjugative transposon protein TraM n=1 Tax=Spirosoma luteum TaxID=431553 RepID=UPI00037CC273|nr:conjugative transposon protein TraM [Spirosoma luteum]